MDEQMLYNIVNVLTGNCWTVQPKA